MINVEYEYYQNTFDGKLIPQENFSKLVKNAVSDFNYFTNGRIANQEQVTDDIRDIICKFAELNFEQEQLRKKLIDDRNVQSETVGSHSITFVNNSSIINDKVLDENEILQKEYQICLKDINNKSLMYRGN